MPIGCAAIGLPTGVQLVGPAWDAATVLRVGRALARVVAAVFDTYLVAGAGRHSIAV